MRTTITFDDDVAAGIERVRRQEGIGVSEAVNSLVRAGLVRPQRADPYLHRTVRVGLKVDVTNIADVLDLLDESPTVADPETS